MITQGKDLYVWWSEEWWERTKVKLGFCKAEERTENHVKGEWMGIWMQRNPD